MFEHGSWVIQNWDDEGSAGKSLYKVEFAGKNRLIVEVMIEGRIKYMSLSYSEVTPITEEEAMLFLLEK
jgi:hypothetical protein